MMRACWWLALVAGVWVIPSTAAASPAAKLTYLRRAGAHQCPDEAQFRTAVAARVGYDLFFPWARHTVMVEIESADRGYRGKVSIADEAGVVQGERQLRSTSEDCGEIVRALALAVSIAVDDFDVESAPPLTEDERTEPRDAGPLIPPLPPAATVGAPPPRAEPASSDITPSVVTGAIASFGIAPSVALGGRISVAVRRRWLGMSLDLRGDLPAARAYESGRISTDLLAATLGLCAHSSFLIYGCALELVGRFSERGDVSYPQSAAAFFSATGVRLGSAIGTGGPFFIDTHVDALATLTPHRVQIDGNDVFSVRKLTVSAGAGLGMRF